MNILNAITVYYFLINPALCFYGSRFHKVLDLNCDSILNVK